MNGTGRVASIHVSPEAGAAMEQVTEVDAVAGQGLRGDRYFQEAGTFSDGTDARELTLIEAEALSAIERENDIRLEPGAHRRNLVTEDVALNHLVGERFRVGSVVCEGVKLCEPCSHLQSLTEDGVLPALVHRGGLNARIVEGGTIRADDEIGPA